jgi:hypothetical protein
MASRATTTGGRCGVLLKIDAGLTGVARFLIMSEQGSDWRVDRAVLNIMGT